MVADLSLFFCQVNNLFCRDPFNILKSFSPLVFDWFGHQPVLVGGCS